MNTIDREQYIMETRLRGVIRKGIKVILENKKKDTQKKKESLNEEQRLRKVVRRIIKEAQTGDNDPAPHSSTGINVLEDLLKKIIPVLEMDFKKLTSDSAQRKSFRSHVINAVEDTLAPSRAMDVAEEAPDVATPGPELALEQEEIEVNIEDEETADQEDPMFIDIEDEPKASAEPEDPRDTFGIEGEDETGRNVAFESFKKISSAILDAYDVLGNDEDKSLFYDYLITNLKLYFDKFEKDLVGAEEPTTDEYEQQKQAAV